MLRILSLKSFLVTPQKLLPLPRNYVSVSGRNCTSPGIRNSGISLLRTSPTSTVLFTRNAVTSKGPKFNATKRLEALQRKDGVPPRYHLIYRSDLANYFGGAQMLAVLMFLGAGLTVGSASWKRMHPDEGKEGDDGTESKTEPSSKEAVGEPGALDRIKEVVRENRGTEEFRLRPTLEEGFDTNSDAIFGVFVLSATLYYCLCQMLRRIPVRMYTAPSGNVISVHLSALFPGRKVLRDFPAGTLRRIPSNIDTFKDIHYQDPNGNHYFLVYGYFRQPADLENLIEKGGD